MLSWTGVRVEGCKDGGCRKRCRDVGRTCVQRFFISDLKTSQLPRAAEKSVSSSADLKAPQDSIFCPDLVEIDENQAKSGRKNTGVHSEV